MRRAAKILHVWRRAKPGFSASKGRTFAGSRILAALAFAAALSVLLAPLDEALAQAQTNLEQIVAPPRVMSRSTTATTRYSQTGLSITATPTCWRPKAMSA